MSWYRFWKKSGPMQGLSEEYIWLPKEVYPTQQTILKHCEYLAERMPRGHETMYEYGFTKINSPPREVLEKMIIRESMQIDTRTKHLGLLQQTLGNLSDREEKKRKKRKKK